MTGQRRRGRCHRYCSGEDVSANGLASGRFYQYFPFQDVLGRFRCPYGHAFVRESFCFGPSCFVHRGRPHGKFLSFSSIAKGAFSHRHNHVGDDSFVRRRSIREGSPAHLCFGSLSCFCVLEAFCRGVVLPGRRNFLESRVRRDASVAFHPICHFVLGRLSCHVGRRCDSSFQVLAGVGNSRHDGGRRYGLTRMIFFPSALPDLFRR